jgi:integrase
MAVWVEKRPRAGKPPRWRVRSDHPPVSRTFSTKAEALHYRNTVLGEVVTGQVVSRKGGQTVLADWIRVWESGRATKASTADVDRRRVRNHILPPLGQLPLELVNRPTTVRAWLADLRPAACKGCLPSCGHRLSPTTVRHCYVLLHGILTGAAKDGLIRDPVTLGPADLPEQVPADIRAFTEQEVDRLTAAMHPHYRPLIAVLENTGLRWGEAAGLTAGRVDLLGQPPALTVWQAMAEVGGKRWLDTPKSPRSRRVVSLPPAAVEALLPLIAGKRPDELVFTTVQGRSMSRLDFRRGYWTPAIRAAGVSGTPHALRHTHASRLIAAGVPVALVSRRLGHASVAVTERTYFKWLPDNDAQILTALANFSRETLSATY